MKLRDIKVGMTLQAVGDYGGCIEKGRIYLVEKNGHGRFIRCAEGSHQLDRVMVDKHGDIPELEPIANALAKAGSP